MNEAIRDVIVITRGEAVKHGISVDAQLAEALPAILGDRVQLQQVILNLIINAIEAMGGVRWAAPTEYQDRKIRDGWRLGCNSGYGSRARSGNVEPRLRSFLHDEA